VASVNYRPAKSPGGKGNVEALQKFTAEKLSQPVDLIVFGEGVTVVGSGRKYEEVAEPAQGYTAEELAKLARSKHSYVVAGIYERDGDVIYNTAILLDRAGKLAGKYRKVYLPREEVERGLFPGKEMAVFETDFGKLGLMICYDVFFAEPAKALAMRGAEIIAMPIWGGNETLARARSIEGRVFLAAAGYDHPTYVQDPNGERLAEARENYSIAYAEIDLSRRYREPYLGDMKARRQRETLKGLW
jgi:predicted amidohydrolase